MGLVQNVAIVALFSGAYISNPDEDSFRRFIETEYKRGNASWLEAKLASIVTSNLIKRDVNKEADNWIDYYFFSIVRIPTEKVSYLGLFSRWFFIPPNIAAKISSN